MEEISLSHILNAEGEKLQHFLKRDVCHLEDYLAINKSVNKTIRSILKAQMLLVLKLEEVVELAEQSPCRKKCHHQCEEEPDCYQKKCHCTCKCKTICRCHCCKSCKKDRCQRYCSCHCCDDKEKENCFFLIKESQKTSNEDKCE